jgi:heme exporter protein B
MNGSASGKLSRRVTFWRAVWTIARKDLRTELRSRQLVTAMGLFAVLATMIFYYTLEGRPDVRIAAVPAVLWVITVFAGTLGLNRGLSQEQARGTLDGLLLAPIDRAALFYGKLFSTWLFTLVVGALVSLAVAILFNLRVSVAPWLLILMLGTLGFSAVGTLLGSMATYAMGRETALPIIILPVTLPIIIAAVSASLAIIAGRDIAEWGGWLVVLASMDGLFMGAALLLFEYVVEE